MAKILANDLIQVYIENQLSNLNKHIGIANSDIGKMRLQWTESKTALIELIYALQSYAVFDIGKSDIKAIATYFENVFEIDLGDFYHTYLEIRNRKINRTKFLDSLKDAIIRKMDEQDEK